MSVEDQVLLSVENLKKHYPITKGVLRREIGRVRAVDGISFELRKGETLGLIGESGCGKSTAATSLLRLEEPTDGTVTFEGDDITSYGKKELKRFRRRVQIIFQDPTSTFDPRMSIGESVEEPLITHGIRDKERREDLVKSMLERVGLSARDYDRYPHELSGGQKQRAALARALVLQPDLLIADEPVSALDVSVQAEILALLEDLQREFDLSILLISHDMGIIKEVCERIAVMYLGEIVEKGPTETILGDPQHPYTRALVASIPTPEPGKERTKVELSGEVPDPSNPPEGCRFHTRCPEIIPPENYDFEQEEWRSVMDFRISVAERDINIDAIRDQISDRVEKGEEDLTNSALREEIREEFGIPEEVGDENAESILSNALEHVVNEDFESADELMKEEFTTVCQERNPDLQETSAGHPASCHLHDSDTKIKSVVTED
ncbi:MAG: oligopeptide/dipeptide ABC transporter ATP-binding protein [Halobacteria archaeon]|nr:oligopeptide/dipeptide ABC transporter ATP-binding protein [Halobacteria archaeon]